MESGRWRFRPMEKCSPPGQMMRRSRLWDVTTNTNTATLEGHEGRVASVAFSPDEKCSPPDQMMRRSSYGM